MGDLVVFRKTDEGAALPKQAYPQDAAYDVAAAEDVIIPRGERVRVRTGLVIEWLQGDFHPQLCSRSGLAAEGIDVVGGIVDPGYRGEISVLLANNSKSDFVVAKGDRIAQMRFVMIARPTIGETDKSMSEYPPTGRFTRGFGSSGI